MANYLCKHSPQLTKISLFCKPFEFVWAQGFRKIDGYLTKEADIRLLELILLSRSTLTFSMAKNRFYQLSGISNTTQLSIETPLLVSDGEHAKTQRE